MNFFQKLFSQPRSETVETTEMKADTDTPVEPANPVVEEIKNTLGNLQQLPPGVHIGMLSDVGRHRERNEDSSYIVHSVMQHDLGTEPFSLFVVADGMGGHQKGEMASSLAARTAANSLLEDVYLPYLTNNQSANNRPLTEALTAAVDNANAAVIESVPDGGTTLTLALVMGNNAYIAHVGDSRAYVFKDDSLKQITQDHSLSQRLEELGQSAEEVKQVQNVLYRAIGQGQAVEVDTHMQHLPSGASLLLCSDGLWGLVEEADIIEILKSASTPQESCEKLIEKANDNGGLDNITAIVVSMGTES